MRYLRYLPVLVVILACLYSGGIYLFGRDDARQSAKETPAAPKKEQTSSQENKTTGELKPVTPLEPKQDNSSPKASNNPDNTSNPEKPKVKDNSKDSDEAPNLAETPGDNQAKANKIISTRLTKNDIARLRALAKDGLTAAEEKEALAILRARIPEKEFAFLYNKIYLPYVKKRVSK